MFNYLSRNRKWINTRASISARLFILDRKVGSGTRVSQSRTDACCNGGVYPHTLALHERLCWWLAIQPRPSRGWWMAGLFVECGLILMGTDDKQRKQASSLPGEICLLLAACSGAIHASVYRVRFIQRAAVLRLYRAHSRPLLYPPLKRLVRELKGLSAFFIHNLN